MFKEKVQRLLEAVKNQSNEETKKVQLNFIEDSLKSLPEYVNAVVMMQFQTMVAHTRYDDNVEEFQNVVQNLDRQRRTYHLSLVGSINGLNRLSKIMNIEPFFTKNINGIEYGKDKEFDAEYDSRRAVAECAKDFVDEMWYEGRYRQQGKDICYTMGQSQEKIIDTENIMDRF